MADEDFNKYDNDIVDTDEILGQDVNINPQYYIHNALIRAQKCLAKDNLQEGLVQFRFLIEHIEVLCKAANMITPEYATEIKNYIATKEYLEDKSEIAQSVKLANKKIELLMKQVFSSVASTEPLKL